MPRMTRVVIRPKVGQNERDQIVSTLMEQLKQYYCQTSEETLFNLASTIENQAFGHAQTRHQYSDNLKSLSSKEIDKANQVYEEINGSNISCLGTSPCDAGMGRVHNSAFSNQRNTPYCNNSDDVDGRLREQDKKVRQKLARQRIIARQRKRMRSVSSSVEGYCQDAPRQEAEARPCNKNEKNSNLPQKVPSHVHSRASKRLRTDCESSTADTMEWYNRLIDVTGSDVGSSFLEELSVSDFGISDDCDDIETCPSSTGSRASTLMDLE